VTLPRSTVCSRLTPAPGRLSPTALLGIALVLGCGETIDALESGDTFGGIYDRIEALSSTCSDCHAPGAPGRTDDIEGTQDWSTRDTAYTTLHGEASDLIGNFAGCNGVPFLGETAETSLLIASLDETVRASFSVPGNADCNADAIADQTVKLGGPLPDDILQDLRAWVDDGAP